MLFSFMIKVVSAYKSGSSSGNTFMELVPISNRFSFGRSVISPNSLSLFSETNSCSSFGHFFIPVRDFRRFFLRSIVMRFGCPSNPSRLATLFSYKFKILNIGSFKAGKDLTRLVYRFNFCRKVRLFSSQKMSICSILF